MRSLGLVIGLSFTAALWAQNGIIVTVAGNGTTGTSGLGGPAANAPTAGGAIGVDSADNFYIAERPNNRVIKVDGATGIVTLFAGNGTAASAGDGGPATQASLNGPDGITADAAGNVFITEGQGNRVRRVDAATGIVTTVAGNGTAGFAGDGGPAVNAMLRLPTGVAVDPAGNLYIAEAGNYRVRRVDAVTGIITTVAGNGSNTHSPDGTPALNAGLATPFVVSLDRNGDLLISELYAYAVRRISAATGLLSTVAGNGGTVFNGDGSPATAAAVGFVLSQVVPDAAGNLYFSDGTGRIRRVDANGIITTVAGAGAGAHGQTSASAGGSGGGGGGTYTCPSGLGDNGPATIATIDAAIGLGLTSRGALLISDFVDCRVRSVQLPSPLLYTSTNLTLNGTTLTAAVTPIGGSTTPTGTVQFLEYQTTGPATPLASAPLTGGVATLDTGALSLGSHQLMAIYLGDGAYNGSGSAVVAATGGGRAVPSMGAIIGYPQVSTPIPITVTAAGTHGQPTGTVQIWEGATMLANLTLVNGSAQYSYLSSVPGDHPITFQYSGDTNYTPYTWTYTITLLSPSTVTVSSDVNPAAYGTPVTFTVAVSPATATGTVALYDNGVWEGTQYLTNGRLSVTVPNLSVGTHNVTATYSGDRLVAQGNSNVLVETINPPTPTTLTLTSSLSPSTYGQPVTLTATVSPTTAPGQVTFYDNGITLGTATLAGGTASISASQLFAGIHSLSASYSAAGYQSSSGMFTQTVNKAPTSAPLVSSLNPANAGQSITFTVTITPAAATGSVQFLDGATVLGTVTISGGAASFATATLAAGNHSITAVYSGDANYAATTSAAVNQVVKTVTTTGISAPASSPWGVPVTISAVVLPATATGTVQFFEGAALLGTGTLNVGVASTAPLTLAVGTHSITAVYAGDALDAGSTAAAVTVTIQKANVTLSLSSSANPSAAGQAIAFTAAGAPADATGMVQFFDGATLLGSAPLYGSAALTTSALAAGSHSLTAVYSGDGNYNGSTTVVLVQTVKATTTTTVSAAAGTITVGQNVQLTATVTPASAGGTVQFLDGATVLGSGTLSSGTASLTASNLSVGTHSITAVYGGDANDGGSTSGAVTVTVNKVAASVALVSSLNPAASGQGVTFTATVTPAAATGTVQFLDGATVLGSATLAGGTASLTTSTLASGGHSVTAVYSGDANDNGATSSVLTQTVKATTTTALSAASGSITFGQSVQLTVSVTPSSATGSVQFLDGATVLGSASLSGATASLTAANLAVGTHSITAVYSGDANDGGSTSAAVTVTVTKAIATVTVASSLNPAGAGQTVAFTATVAAPAATGSVQFLDGATVLGTAAVSGGAASLSIATLAAGSHSITAVYSGDSNYNGATSAALLQTVKAATTTTISASSGSIILGQSVQLTAMVAPSSATGTVQFLDGATVLGSASLSAGTAALTVPNLAVGTHAITATYGGDANDGGSSSAAVTVTVSKASASVTVASSLNPSVAGQSLTISATVSPTGATGSVQFLDGATAIGTAPVSAGVAYLTTSALAAGSHSITAVYSGDGGYNGASSAALAQTVKAVTSTALASDKSTAVAGQTVTFTATVSPAAATGSVQFLDGATVLGTVGLSGGSAALAVSNLAVGTHSVTASYGGAAGYAPSVSAPVGVTITAAPPTAPSNLAATTASANQINLTWTASTTPGVTYNVYASTTAGFTPSAANRVASGVSATSYSHSGLASSTTYYYRVTAQNANGESAATNQASATTQGAPSLSCQVTYSVTTQWNVGFGTAISIKNNGNKAINSWQLTWTWPGNQQITQAWNSNYSQNGNNATLTNASWNGTISPGTTISGIGFNASYSGQNNSPTAFYINGTRCQ